MKIGHCEDMRTLNQNVYVETADGRFRYRLDMDYAKELPEKYKDVPILGNVAGGCCDKDGNLYITLRGGGQPMRPATKSAILKFDKDGKYLTAIGEGTLGGLHFMNITPENTMLITTVGEHTVIEMDQDGKVLMTLGTRFKSNGNILDDIETDPNWMRIHRGIFPTEPYLGYDYIASTYAQMLNFNNMQYSEEPFNTPADVDQDSEGNIYVADGYGNFAIHKFDRQGNKLKTWGGKGVFDCKTETPGKFVIPHSLCVDANDNVWVGDREKDAIHVFDKEGNVLAYFSHNLAQPSGIDTDGSYVYVVGRGGFLTIFDLNFNVVGELGFYNGNLRGHDIAADSEGNLYLFPTHANWEHQIIALKRVK